MAGHELKSWPDSFSAVNVGLKLAEFRFNDWGFCVGDTLTLREWEPTLRQFTGRFVRKRIQHVADLGPWAPGYVLLSLSDL